MRNVNSLTEITETLPVECENLTNNPPYLGNGARYDGSYYYSKSQLSTGTKIGDLE